MIVLNTRRRALGLLLAAATGLRVFSSVPRAFAAKTDCFDSKAFGAWKGQATDSQAGARINQVKFENPDSCDLRADVQVAASFDSKLVVYGDRDKIKLPKKFLIDPANRLIVRAEDGKEAVNEPLCGNCTDIFDNKVSIVLPLAASPLFREGASVEIAVKLGDKEECRVKLDCETLRKALTWAEQRQGELAQQFADEKCTPPEGGCFITTACCEVLGLDEDCFELRALRRYRDRVLASRPGGRSCAPCPMRRGLRAFAPSMPASFCRVRSQQGSASTHSPTGSMCACWRSLPATSPPSTLKKPAGARVTRARCSEPNSRSGMAGVEPGHSPRSALALLLRERQRVADRGEGPHRGVGRGVAEIVLAGLVAHEDDEARICLKPV